MNISLRTNCPLVLSGFNKTRCECLNVGNEFLCPKTGGNFLYQRMTITFWVRSVFYLLAVYKNLFLLYKWIFGLENALCRHQTRKKGFCFMVQIRYCIVYRMHHTLAYSNRSLVSSNVTPRPKTFFGCITWKHKRFSHIFPRPFLSLLKCFNCLLIHTCMCVQSTATVKKKVEAHPLDVGGCKTRVWWCSSSPWET